MRYTFDKFKAEFPDDAACLDAIMDVQYGGTEFECPACHKGSKFHRISKRRAYSCQFCGHHIYPCVGTPFENSRTKLHHWFFAMYLLTSTRHGVAAKEIERQLGVTYKCAWRICHELRKLMATADFQGPLSGAVEIDETRVGGKTAMKRKNANKTVVMGMVERDGNLRAAPIPTVSKAALQDAILKNVRPGSVLMTDEWIGYEGIKEKGPFHHLRVNHSAGEYVRGPVHTNTIEGYWSRLKNSIRGTHVHVSQKHLWKYVSEFSFRFNNRKEPAAMFSRLLAACALPRLADA